MPAYRKTLALSFLFKFLVSAAKNLDVDIESYDQDLDAEVSEAIHRQPSESTRDNSDPYALETVGRQIPHSSGLKHVTGEGEPRRGTRPPVSADRDFPCCSYLHG